MAKLLCCALIVAVVAAATGFRISEQDNEITGPFNEIFSDSFEIPTTSDEREEDVDVWFKCPTPEGLFRNPRNCSSFIQCAHGKPHVMPCPKGLHYSEETKRCEQPCEAYCNRTLSCKCEWKTCGLPRECFLPKETGPCRASIPRYYFNKRTGHCEKFTYGGCKGNKNNFETKEACEKRCSKSSHSEDDEISQADEQFELRYKCPNDGLFPNPLNCSTFLQCSNGRPYIMPCPKGLHYSVETKRCEEPCKAYCNRTLSCECQWPTCGLPPICFLPKETGPCRASIPRYYFNKLTGVCEKFTYGGCEGNKNNFETKESCEKRCSKRGEHSANEVSSEFSNSEEEEELSSWFRCPTQNGLFPNPRSCSSFIQCSNGQPHVMPCPQGLHYSEETKRCEEPCKAYCSRSLSCKCEWKTCGLNRVCFQPKKTGPCRASIPRYYFNKRTGVCEKFTYGGCEGNKNNFETKESCEKRCSKSSHSEDDEISNADEQFEARYKCVQDGLYPNPRNCSTFIQCSNGKPYVMPCPKGLHYNVEKKRCERPCEAYCNRTLSCECKWPTCGLPATCFFPKDSGPCQASKQRYFFNKRTGQCEQFIYGGCKGSPNNFETKEDCEKRCSKPSGEPSTCLLPKEVGPCKGHIPRYYYNKDSGKCEKFIYGGCKGNDNNFGTKEECDARCSKDSVSEHSSEIFNSEEDEEDSESWFQCPHKTGLYPNPRNCSSFIQCSNGQPNVMPCPKGLHYSEETKRCEQQCDAYCNRTLSCKCEWKTCGLPRECFLSKNDGPCHASKQRYFFNKRTGQCEQFIYGGCKGNKNNFETKEACEKRCSKSDHSEDDEISNADEQFEVRYKCLQDGLYRNPRNCSTFIQCSNGKPYVMPCPKGLHYSEETKRCEEPCKAYCNRTLSCECKWPTCGLPRVCFLPKETGRCQANMPRYFFNKRTGQCEKFTYGGCGGNPNNFETKEACEKRCSKTGDYHEEDISAADEELELKFKCYKDGLYSNPRNCSSYIQCSNGKPYVMPCPKGLHYDVKTKRCEQQCKAFCNRTLSCECKWPTCGLPDQCFLPSKTGPCRDIATRYFFNKRTGHCERFTYGGCRANANNFPTKEACEKICRSIKDELATSEEQSHEDFSVSEEDKPRPWFKCGQDGLYRNPRNCSSFIQCSNGQPHVMSCPKGLHYSEETKRCEEPCKAYCNRTLSCECKWPTCGLNRVCFLSKVVGPCRAKVPRWFFNKRTGVCEQFIYGGCGGNTNNFETKELCEKRCSKKFVCPSANGDFPHPKLQELFIRCKDNVPSVRHCPRSQVFSPPQHKCVDLV